MSGTCEREGCTEGWMMACAHKRWCWPHAFAHMDEADECRTDIGTAFTRLLRVVVWPAVKLREAILPARLELMESLQHVYDHFYYAFEVAYQDAGAPLGDDEEAALRWLEAQFESPAN